MHRSNNKRISTHTRSSEDISPMRETPTRRGEEEKVFLYFPGVALRVGLISPGAHPIMLTGGERERKSFGGCSHRVCSAFSFPL